MGHESEPAFCTLHALRIKGFAPVDTIGHITLQTSDVVTAHLGDLADAEYAQYREARGLWQLTPAGREHHLAQLCADTAPVLPNAAFAAAYRQFLAYNGQFKELCGKWQLVDGQPNDHSDAGYDAAAIENLAHLHVACEPVVDAFGDVFDRMQPYRGRLEAVVARIQEGESNMFTGVMCGSYHDVWMELHEDLILTQGLDRHSEGSF